VTDLVLLVATLAFFAACILYGRALDRI